MRILSTDATLTSITADTDPIDWPQRIPVDGTDIALHGGQEIAGAKKTLKFLRGKQIRITSAAGPREIVEIAAKIRN